MIRKVLLVDDDAAVREALGQTLELADYQPVTAGSFVAAKDHIRPEFPGVIVPRISRIRPTLSAVLISALGPPMSVCTHPGWRMATFTPLGARSMAALFITALSAAFDER